MVKIASWNVNSIKARLPNVLDWLKSASPDIVLLQEIKCIEENFPALEIGDLGYNAAVSGQKTYNGVAILSKTPLDVEQRALPGGGDDEQARYIEAVTQTDAGPLRVASIYLPNGNPVDSDKLAYKLAWMARLEAHAGALLALEEATVLGGDYNVIPSDEDCSIAPNPVRPSARLFIVATPMPSGPCTTSPAPIPSGTTSAAPGRRTTASASITCCSHRRPPTYWPMAASTANHGAGRRPPITRRSGAR